MAKSVNSVTKPEGGKRGRGSNLKPCEVPHDTHPELTLQPFEPRDHSMHYSYNTFGLSVPDQSNRQVTFLLSTPMAFLDE